MFVPEDKNDANSMEGFGIAINLNIAACWLWIRVG